ncbi:uncharacterized protein F4812DRAFT_258111 [Daldinia caldariorum]|uniref:uncharacterized protein n=1 Tax=Daldinia caldariorum TaxID=326644 RepID=UPI002007E670|nr:uncharacterized protein F4812DRAFT_258111 [Daldinia caldariorum]KAI1470242.1 hypothetical protein F4812DRAFT_258111 [Daldinia caldariorum]
MVETVRIRRLRYYARYLHPPNAPPFSCFFFFFFLLSYNPRPPRLTVSALSPSPLLELVVSPSFRSSRAKSLLISLPLRSFFGFLVYCRSLSWRFIS